MRRVEVMLLLALDCSTARGSVALGRRTPLEPVVIVDQKEFRAGRGCGGEMFLALQSMLAAGADEPLGEIIVGLGPGSYSGVRQSIAAAIGLAAGTGAALFGAPSALALADAPSAYQAVGDARRGTFYYTAVEDGHCVAGPELLADAAALADRLAARCAWPAYVVEAPLPGGALADCEICLPCARRLLFLAETARQAAPLEPIYLRPVSVTLPRALQVHVT